MNAIINYFLFYSFVSFIGQETLEMIDRENNGDFKSKRKTAKARRWQKGE